LFVAAAVVAVVVVVAFAAVVIYLSSVEFIFEGEENLFLVTADRPIVGPTLYPFL
jgi:hypothetical protein